MDNSIADAQTTESMTSDALSGTDANGRESNGSSSIAMKELSTTLSESLLSIGKTLRAIDQQAFNETVAQLVQQLPGDTKRDLARKLRSPKNTIGIFANDPMWAEIDEAIERNRKMDALEIE
jgi:hypothetical protein